MIKACVIGHPLSHSLSPVIHNYWFEKYGIEGLYEAMPVDPENLISMIAMLRQMYNGFNVTIPFKRAVLKLCDTLDAGAETIEAVNTVIVTAERQMIGRNTDAYGFAQNLQQKYPDFDWRKGPALILGAGGAARAIAYAMREKNVPQIIICNRTKEHAEVLAGRYSGTTLEWNRKHEFPVDLNFLVNTTALGMRGQPPLDLDLSDLPKNALVYDIVYTPLMTDLLRAAAARGNPIVTGIGMLLHQAVPAFETWTGMRPDVDAALEKLVLSKTS